MIACYLDYLLPIYSVNVTKRVPHSESPKQLTSKPNTAIMSSSLYKTKSCVWLYTFYYDNFYSLRIVSDKLENLNIRM